MVTLFNFSVTAILFYLYIDRRVKSFKMSTIADINACTLAMRNRSKGVICLYNIVYKSKLLLLFLVYFQSRVLTDCLKNSLKHYCDIYIIYSNGKSDRKGITRDSTPSTVDVALPLEIVILCWRIDDNISSCRYEIKS